MEKIEATNGSGPQIGDPCPRDSCDGILGVYCTRIIADRWRYRYLHCRKCACRPEDNIQVLPLRVAPPRVL